MSLNQNHSRNGGLLLSNGESVLRESQNVELSFSDVSSKTDLLKGTKKGNIYLTPYRVVFVSSSVKDPLRSAMFPFYLMKGCSIEQPVFGANYIKGTVAAEPGGGWEGQAHFKMSFTSGGAIELGQHLFKLATNASRGPAPNSSSSSYGYPSPGGMNYGYGAPPAYPAPPPATPHNGFYQAGNMGYPPPTAGMYPSGLDYMAPPPPYPGPPQAWTASPPPPGNAKAMEAAGSGYCPPAPPHNAYYDPRAPHSVYMPSDRPPPTHLRTTLVTRRATELR